MNDPSVAPRFEGGTRHIDEDLEGHCPPGVDGEAGSAEAIATTAARRLTPCIASLDTHVHVGPPAHEILATAEEVGADLIVLGSRGRSPFGEWLLGSVSKAVLERSNRAVLVARLPVKEVARVLVAYDGSAPADEAVRWVMRLPLPAGFKVRILSVAETAPLPAAEPGVLLPVDYGAAVDLREEHRRGLAEEGARKAVERLRANGIEVQSEARCGDAASEIVDAANAWSADLLVLGAHSHRGWVEDLMGNTARAVVKWARCSVLVAQPAAHAPRRTDDEASSLLATVAG